MPIATASDLGLAQSGVPVSVNSRTGQVQIETPNGIRVNSLFKKDEWEMLMNAVIEAKRERMNGVQHLRDRNLVRQISFFNQVPQWNVRSEFTRANQNMTGESRGQQDGIDYRLDGISVPVTYKEFHIGERELGTSRLFGEALDTGNVVEATRVVAEELERTLWNGSAAFLQNAQTYGYLNHPTTVANSDTAANYGGGSFAAFDGAVANDNILPTIKGMIQAATQERVFGGLVLYVSSTQYEDMSLTYYTDQDVTPLDRIERFRQIVAVHPVDTTYLPDGNLLMVPMDRMTVEWFEAMPIQIREWASADGMTHNFKVLAVSAPAIKDDYNNRNGIIHATGAA